MCFKSYLIKDVQFYSYLRTSVAYISTSTSLAVQPTRKDIPKSIRIRRSPRIGYQAPIISAPDYSYKDGRQVLPKPRERFRRQEELRLIQQIFDNLETLEFIKQRHAQMTDGEAQEREQIMISKFKPKDMSINAETGEIEVDPQHQKAQH